MGLVHVRVDERLVHGIVATSWIPAWNPDRVICIDREAAENPVMKSALRIATPSSVALSVLPYENVRDNLLAGKYEGHRYVIIAKNPLQVYQLIKDGYEINEITMGTVWMAEGRKRINKTISLTEEELAAIKEMAQNNVKIFYQFRPDDIAVDFMSLCK